MKYKLIFFIFVVYGLSHSSIIRIGNVLDIKVSSHPEFSGQFEVNSNGTIDYPLLADQTIVDISTSELMNDLTFRLARHIDNPLVLVSIIKKPEITVNVLGQVVNPGPVQVFHGASLQEAIIKAGGPLEQSADLSKIKIIHHDQPDNPVIYNLEEFLKSGDIKKMPPLGPEDIIIVLALEHPRKVKIIGAVQKPGVFTIEDTVNIFEAIYLAGGPSEKADLRRVRILSSSENNNITESIIDIQRFLDQGNIDNIPKVHVGDVIIVYTRWFDWKSFMTVLNNVLLFLVSIQTLTGLINK
ncbi:MAG: hypothetical protein GXY77_18825 [Fibrobacter sp.]|nr:hypothetical protein [Fibrobacter sp.]